MRVSEKKQILTTSAVNLNGVQIPTDCIDWSVYDKNPVLLYNRASEGHKGVVVGKVLNRERVGDAIVANLAFMERNEDADIAFEKYEQGVLPHVSVGGYARGEENSEGVFICDKYMIREVSLVAFPANIECAALDDNNVLASEQTIVEGMRTGKTEIRYVTLSWEGDLGTYKETNASEETQAAETNASEETQAAETNASEETQAEETNASEETQAEETNASEETQAEETNASEGETNHSRPLPKGMTWHEHTINQKPKSFNMDKTFRELNCDVEFQRRLNVLNAAFRAGGTTADNNPENVETVRMIACSMLADQNMVVLANACNFTNSVTKERKNGLGLLVECAAGGAAAATLSAADLGVIKWMSLFYEKLLPNNSFMRSIRFVPMSDREGAIYVESGINPATYTGSVTPVNAPRYFYDDIKRTIAREVFSIQPVTFQNADMAILAYDKQSWGWTIAMDSLMSDVCTYILQVVANTPGIAKVPTTGATFSSNGLFPIEAPNSNVNIKGVSSDDITMAVGAFLVQNYKLNGRRVEAVLSSNLFTKLATDPTFKTILTPQLSGAVGSEFQYNGVTISGRNPVARYNTTSGKPELDPAMYTDGTVDGDGKITDVTPATTTANHVGAGLAFVEGEVIAGVGTIDVIVMPDPTNYGITMSGWMSTGATVARQNGKGVALITPTVVAGA